MCSRHQSSPLSVCYFGRQKVKASSSKIVRYPKQHQKIFSFIVLVTASSLSVVVGVLCVFVWMGFSLNKVYALVTYPKTISVPIGNLGIQIVTVYRLSERLPFVYRVFWKYTQGAKTSELLQHHKVFDRNKKYFIDLTLWFLTGVVVHMLHDPVLNVAVSSVCIREWDYELVEIPFPWHNSILVWIFWDWVKRFWLESV